MRTAKPRVNLLYLSAINECRDAGVVLEPDDYIWLHFAASRASGAMDYETPAFIEIPVVVGNVTLWPMTIGALCWWEQFGKQWYEGDNAAEVLAIAFCMAHGKSPEQFQGMTTKGRADLALVKWQTCINATLSQMAWGIDKVNGQTDYVFIDSPNEVKSKSPSAVDWGDIIAKLCATYHQPPEHFLWRLSESAALELLAKAPAPFGYEKDSDGEKSRAFAEFREVVRHIILTRKAA